jgi:hypothetical protein
VSFPLLRQKEWSEITVSGSWYFELEGEGSCVEFPVPENISFNAKKYLDSRSCRFLGIIFNYFARTLRYNPSLLPCPIASPLCG